MESVYDRNAIIRNRTNDRIAKMTEAEKRGIVNRANKSSIVWLIVGCSIAITFGLFDVYFFMDSFATEEGGFGSPFTILAISGVVAAFIALLKLLRNKKNLLFKIIRQEVEKELVQQEKIASLECALGGSFKIAKMVDLETAVRGRYKLIFDNENKCFAYLRDDRVVFRCDYNKVIKYEVYENGVCKMQRNIDSSADVKVVGVDRDDECKNLSLIIQVSDFNSPEYIIKLVENDDIEKDSSAYNKIMTSLRLACSTLDFIINENCSKLNEAQNQNINRFVSTQIKELKSLLDDGLITQEEYEQKKKQILEI